MAKRTTPEINAGSMADIAFLLLSFFLLTTTMDLNKGMPRRLPPMPEENAKVDPNAPKINKRNIMQVHVNRSDRLMVNGREMDVTLLKEEVKTFILNPSNDENKSEKKPKAIENFKTMDVSEAVVSLQTDRGTSYKIYMEVQNEIMKAYNEIRNEFSGAEFGKTFSDLDEEQQDVVKAIYPLNVSEAEPRGKVAKSK